MLYEFDKKILLNNISYLIEQSNIKIGELEANSGVSTGYISRLSKDDKSKPGIEFIIGISNILNISIDTLLKIDLSSLTYTEQYLVKFLDKLNRDTLADKLLWNKELADVLNRYEEDVNGYVNHPMLSYEQFYETNAVGYPEEVSRVVFVSNAFNCNTYIGGDCFNLKIKNGYYIYLMNINKSVHYIDDSEALAKEIWMLSPNQEKTFLCSTKDKPELSKMVENLYISVSELNKHPKLKKDLQTAIDGFMNDDFSNDPIYPEDIPF